MSSHCLMTHVSSRLGWYLSHRNLGGNSHCETRVTYYIQTVRCLMTIRSVPDKYNFMFSSTSHTRARMTEHKLTMRNASEGSFKFTYLFVDAHFSFDLKSTGIRIKRTAIESNLSALDQIMCHGTKPLLEPMFTYHQKSSVAFTGGNFS